MMTNKDTKKVSVPIEKITGKIFMIRGEKVMLDRDLAALYGVETRSLNQAVSRNIERFPSDFMFTLSRDEIMGISQIVISSKIKFSKNVRAFTEQGVAMLQFNNNGQLTIYPMKFMNMTAKRISLGQTTDSAAKENWLYKRKAKILQKANSQ